MVLAAGASAVVLLLYWAEGSLHPKRSTRRLWQATREAGKPWWRFLDGYIYARWPLGYIGSAIGERGELRWLRPLFAPFLLTLLRPRRWANGYHGKVMPTESVKRLVSIHEDIDLTIPEQVIPFRSARDLILSQPHRIVVLDCPCRAAREHPCKPVDVCLIVGEPFASFVLEHSPRNARSITSDEAVQILEAEARRGHVHHAFFKEAMLDRFYAICNCCSCCCGAIQAQRHGTPMLISSGYTSRVDLQRCMECGACVAACPFGAVSLNGHLAIDVATCMGCGVCVSTCRHDALALVRDERKPAPLEVPISATYGGD
jgi:ferredoxin